ncbi:NtaA/DmoA family FMN-dependent monooxygenase [Actinomycetospora cinnamomea]|uniref:FMN-dependent oxidoreductase (Nitrilotriacetate monooxygenase family) n=1 Tax=Actinomycetospora cinnamomea TaxID=663609 RepID=A0A2U1F0Q8_9PSEU|nr:NtaA/DmoA family FMN-dependent monooxygenase [Actinomycetospora cinnamomea]PVZ05756.1 FMN-dependent oxidoreductase (nitrilotriacetate monooxygenase family) [Actinomycetospora cinnamomea]
MPKQIHLAAHFPGVNNTTVWSDPAAGSHIAFASFRHFARTAERAKFDFLFLAEGLRLREQGGRIYDLDVVGRPDNVSILMAMAAVTERIGLAGTVNSTFNEPLDVARKLATLDHLSGGRAAWNVVTSWDEFTGENFRRGGYLPKDKRYLRAEEFLDAAKALWDTWDADEVLADADAGRFVRHGSADRAGRFTYRSDQFDIAGRFPTPRSPQGHPVILQAGDSEEGREFAAASADAIFTRHAEFDAGRQFYADVKARLAQHGRRHEDLKILPAATFVLGDTEDEAAENARQVQYQQVGPATAIAFAEQVWNRDLSDVDPDGPVPSFDPRTSDDVDSGGHISKGRASVRQYKDPVAVAREWRELGEREGLSLREVVIRKNGRHTFVGTPQRVADTIDHFVQSDASDGFVLVPHITPGGLDEFADKVVPLLQEKGSFRTEYTGTTLREHLGLRPSPTTVVPAARE